MLCTYKGLHYLFDAAKRVDILIVVVAPFKELNRELKMRTSIMFHLLGYQSNEHVGVFIQEMFVRSAASITRGE